MTKIQELLELLQAPWVDHYNYNVQINRDDDRSLQVIGKDQTVEKVRLSRPLFTNEEDDGGLIDQVTALFSLPESWQSIQFNAPKQSPVQITCKFIVESDEAAGEVKGLRS